MFTSGFYHGVGADSGYPWLDKGVWAIVLHTGAGNETTQVIWHNDGMWYRQYYGEEWKDVRTITITT